VKISFACPHCAKPLVADSALAGRTGRCRYCGKRTVVPGGQSTSAGQEQVVPGNHPAAADWRTAVASQLPAAGARPSAATDHPAAKPTADAPDGYTLRPVTPVNTPALPASDWDNAELGPAVAAPPGVFTSPAAAPRPATAARPPARVARPPTRVVPPTAAASPTSASVIAALKSSFSALANTVAASAHNVAPGTVRPVQTGASSLLVAYRMFFGLLGRLTAWISETSYTVSFILIILAVASGMVGQHALATLLCGAVVALNLVGLAGDIASLVTLSFRKNPLQGGLFLVPPFTLYYLWTDWYRYRDTVLRMRIPLMTLALVVAAYAFVPWLRGGIKEKLPAVESVEKAVDTVEGELAGQKGVVDEGIKKARSWLREVPLPAPPTLPGLPAPSKPARGRKP